MINFNLQLAVECVKTICNHIQCATCDKLRGPCVRFPCGHLVCEICAETTGECLFCTSSETGPYVVDILQTARLNNVRALLTAFHEIFHLDVFKSKRVSDQLKVEKEVFPKCIQALQKYCNKRKSLSHSKKSIESNNLTYIPGEDICFNTENMKKSHQYVQNWLNQNDMPQAQCRKPFGDINVNAQLLIHNDKKNVLKLNKGSRKIKAKKSTSKNTSSFKQMNNKYCQRQANKIDKIYIDCNTHNMPPRYEKNESGIVIDADSILTEDTENEIIDKDTIACLAVVEAAEKCKYEKKKILSQSLLATSVNVMDSSDIIDNINMSVANQGSTLRQVPFYKKSILFETCKLCNNNVYQVNTSKAKVEENKDISIVINTSDFVTTIKFTQCAEDTQGKNIKSSVSIQTDEFIKLSGGGQQNITHVKRKSPLSRDEVPAKKNPVESLDDKTQKMYCNNSSTQQKCLVIEDSETDSNISVDNTLEVIAEVHRVNESEKVESGILATLSRCQYQHRPKKPMRGQTPNSTDSSDKENYDPNRNKKGAKYEKKNKMKKRHY